jgi:2-methylcitrate dehydratase PrpD
MDSTRKAAREAAVLAAARKVVPIDDASLDWKLELPSGRVEIVLQDGRRFERVGTHVPGSVEAPMGWDDVVRKFISCAPFSPLAPSSQTIEHVHTTMRSLEQVDDATQMLRALS